MLDVQVLVSRPQGHFFDNFLTRSARLRMVTYNSGLERPLLCQLVIEASLKPSGQIATRILIESVPVVDYLPHQGIFLPALEMIFLIWTALQMFKEFFEFYQVARSSGHCITTKKLAGLVVKTQQLML